MLKLLGMITILASSFIMGFIMAQELKDRTKLLREIHQTAIYIKTDLEYRAADISDCFAGRGRLFSAAQDFISEESLLPKDALIKACDKLKQLTKEDKDVIHIYAENIDQEDVGSQIANISWLIENLVLRIRDAEDEYQTKNRLYKSGGAIVGLGFIILLL